MIQAAKLQLLLISDLLSRNKNNFCMEVRGKSIGGNLDVDDKGSEQRWFKSVQSLHHVSVGYQLVRTRIGLAKKAMYLQANREHKQEQKRIILNCR
jgi:hypothetical protein